MKAGDDISIPILNDKYVVAVTWGDIKQVRKVLKRYQYPDYNDESFADKFARAYGLTFTRPDCHPVIAFPCKPKTAQQIGTLAHEATHAVVKIFDDIGERLDGEAFAHSVGAVVRITLQNKNK